MSQKEFALYYHGDQKYGNEPYEKHLDDVYNIAMRYIEHYAQTIQPNANFNEIHWLVKSLCYLHDVIEDTDCPWENLEETFGNRIAEYVSCLTDSAGESRYERKLNTWHKIRRHRITIFIKLCDRIANISHSLETENIKKLTMYFKEHREFKSALFNPHQFQDMWNELDELIDVTWGYLDMKEG